MPLLSGIVYANCKHSPVYFVLWYKTRLDQICLTHRVRNWYLIVLLIANYMLILVVTEIT